MIIYYSTDISDSKLVLVDDEHRHCSKVTRKSPGDSVYVTDGKGHLYTCILEKSNRHESVLSISETTLQPPLPYELAIAIAPTKNNSRFEWFLEKATEIGIHSIYPIHCARSEKANIKAERLNKIITSAVKQSKNLYAPTLYPVQSLSSVIAQVQDFDLRAVAHCANVQSHLKNYISKDQRKIIVAIGPEGDFTREEVDLFTSNKFSEVNLGRARLRTETAGIIACSILANEMI